MALSWRPEAGPGARGPQQPPGLEDAVARATGQTGWGREAPATPRTQTQDGGSEEEDEDD